MTIYRNPNVEERPFTARAGVDLLTAVLQSPVVREVPNEPFTGATDGYIVHFTSRNSVLLPASTSRRGELETSEVSLLMQALHGSFAEHIPFSLSPEVVWYLIAHEVAVHIRLNQDRYRGYFTASDKRETILVHDNSLRYGSDANMWGRSINRVREPMQAMVPKATIDLMLPQFTTSSFETDTALLVLFLDMVSNYYGLMWQTLCGVPAVRVDGSVEDWQTVISHAEHAEREFDGLWPYFDDLMPVLEEITKTIGGQEPDPEFWNSIYKYGGGSGGPYINGWITAFFAHKMTPSGFIQRHDLNWRKNDRNSFSGLVSSNLPTHLSTVPFVWDYFGQQINMAFIAGVMGVEHDGFLNPRLGYGVLEDTRGKLAANQ